MFGLVRKTMLAAVGVAAMTREKVEELVGELVAKGEVTEKEGKELVNELLQKSEATRKTLEAQVRQTVRESLNAMSLATRDDITQLTARIERIEKNMAAGQE
ncbi:MAG: hypothetical protein KAW17_04155 [Candidatus Eisenbacteria sp.]|nr:hypothetical protein [Candidatus Eisenbacteria bacterium]